jgi:hypothetical protein
MYGQSKIKPVIDRTIITDGRLKAPANPAG